MTILSIGMIVKNEAHNLRKTLEALEPLRQAIPTQLIIADTGSEDETVAIAREFTQEVFEIPWENDFAKARNATLKRARGKWFFYIDADEVLEDSENLIEFLQSPESKGYNTIRLIIRNMTSYKNNHWLDFWSPRLFRVCKDTFFFNPIHETYTSKAPVYILQGTILRHSGYNNDDQELMIRKNKRNTKLLEEMLQHVTAPLPRSKVLFDYADTITLVGNQEEAAIEPIKEAIELLKTVSAQKRVRNFLLTRGYSLWVKLLSNAGKFQECLDVCQAYFQDQPERGVMDLDMYYYMGAAYHLTGECALSSEKLEQYFQLLDADRIECSNYFVQPSANEKDKALYIMSNNYWNQQDQENAWQWACQIEKDQVGQVDVRQYQWQIAMAQNTAERFPILYQNTTCEQTKTTMLKSTVDVIGKSADDRRIDLRAGLAAVDDDPRVWPLLVLLADTREVFYTYLYRIPEAHFEPAEGDIIRQMLRLGLPMTDLWSLIDGDRLDEYLNTTEDYHHDLAQLAHQYYSDPANQPATLHQWKLAQYILNYSLFYGQVEQGLIRPLWELTNGFSMEYMRQIYRENILANDDRQVLNPLERFTLVAHQAQLAFTQQDYSQCLREIRQGIAIYPRAKDVAAVLLEEIELLLDPAAKEMKQLAQSVKEQIKTQMAEGNWTVAKTLADELTDIVPDDAEVWSLLAEIQQTGSVIWH